MSEQTIALLVAVFASTGFWTFLSKLIERKHTPTPFENVVLALGRYRLLKLNKYYRDMGRIPNDDYETYISLGESYISAGGNSLVKKGFEENRKLPVKDD